MTLAQDETFGDRLEPIAQDVRRLADLHVDLLRSELRQSTAQATPALASLAVGASLVAASGLLGSLALVHALHRGTRLPLWSCYGLVSGLFGVAGAGLLSSGTHQISEISFIPRET